MEFLIQTEQKLAVEISGNYQHLLEQQRAHEVSCAGSSEDYKNVPGLWEVLKYGIWEKQNTDQMNILFQLS